MLRGALHGPTPVDLPKEAEWNAVGGERERRDDLQSDCAGLVRSDRAKTALARAVDERETRAVDRHQDSLFRCAPSGEGLANAALERVGVDMLALEEVVSSLPLGVVREHGGHCTGRSHRRGSGNPHEARRPPDVTELYAAELLRCPRRRFHHARYVALRGRDGKRKVYCAIVRSASPRGAELRWNQWSGDTALVVTYDQLCAAAAMFIEQYSAHVTACNNTTTTAVTEADQQAGAKLWACGEASRKAEYLSGMADLYAGARTYLLGRQDGCVPGLSGCTTTLIDAPNADFPYMVVVPDYATLHGGPAYFTSVTPALDAYRASVLASGASGLHKALQLAGAIQFETNSSALVTTRVKRSGLSGACTL